MTLITSGWFRRPVGGRIRLRRSTVLLATAFVGLGALYLQIADTEEPPQEVVLVPLTTEVDDQS